MLKRIGMLSIMLLAFTLTTNSVGLITHGRFKAKTEGAHRNVEKLSCDEIDVKDYPLDALIQRIYAECGKNLIFAEPLPTTRVTMTMKGDINAHATLLSGKFGLVFRPMTRRAGQFQADGGYISGDTIDPNNRETWIVCLTDGSPQVAGTIRLYVTNEGSYQLTASAASVKEVIRRVDTLFGDRKQNFAADVAQQLFVLGIDLADSDVNVSLKERFSDFDCFGKKLVQIAYEARLRARDDFGPDIWPLTFVKPSFGSAKAEDDGIDALVTWLNEIYPEQAQVKRSRQNLLIYGQSGKRASIRRLLALIDVPSSQVQMDMWIIQVSGRPDQVAPKIQLIKQDIDLTRAAMAEVQSDLNNIIRDENFKLATESDEALKKLGFDRSPEDALSLNEILIMLACLDKGEVKKKVGNDPLTLQQIISEYKSGVAQRIDNLNTLLMKNYQGHKNVLTPEIQKDLKALLDQQKHYPGSSSERQKNAQALGGLSSTLPRLTRLYSAPAGTNKAIIRLANAWESFQKGEENGPDNLRRENAVVDRLLKAALDAYAADMQEMFLNPLLKRIQALGGRLSYYQESKDKGVTINGRVRMVVSSSLPSTLESTMASYANITRPAPLDLRSMLDSALPGKEPGPVPAPETSAATEGLSGAARVFDSLAPFPAVLLAGALTSEPAPTFREISPGITLKIQPTVLPDSGSARLAVEAEFKVDTNIFGNKENPWSQPPADAVGRHKVETDTIVSVFDLFDISSFSIESSYPQAPFYIPVLGRLPVVGPAFRFPRDKKRTSHESIILVNAVILPRALDLARYYGIKVRPSAAQR